MSIILYSQKHIVSTTLIFLFVLIAALSFYKFFIKEDYVVGYEVSCDPLQNSCFTVCADESCESKTYFSKNQKYKADLYNACGSDITNCKAAETCDPQDRKCSVTYCSLEFIDKANDESCSSIHSANILEIIKK